MPKSLEEVAARMTTVLAVVQAVDVVGNALVPRARLDAHFDRLGVPNW